MRKKMLIIFWFFQNCNSTERILRAAIVGKLYRRDKSNLGALYFDYCQQKKVISKGEQSTGERLL
jgi:hypothetical protein